MTISIAEYNLDMYEIMKRIYETDIVEGHSLLDHYNAVMDGICDMFRSLPLAGAGMPELDSLWHKCSFQKGISYGSDILEFLLVIAKFSSQPGHSKSLIRLIPDAMSVDHVIKLRRIISAHLEYMKSTNPNESHTSLVNALAWVREVETPRSLQHLARRTITRSLHCRGETSLPSCTLIPEHLRDYLAYD